MTQGNASVSMRGAELGNKIYKESKAICDERLLQREVRIQGGLSCEAAQLRAVEVP